MAIGSFLCGYIPLTLSLSPRSMRYISTGGIGLLIGTAFIIIIPEGIHTVYNIDSLQQQRAIISSNTNTGTHTLHSIYSNSQRQLQQVNDNIDDKQIDSDKQRDSIQQLDEIIRQLDDLEKLTASPIIVPVQYNDDQLIDTPQHQHTDNSQAHELSDDISTIESTFEHTEHIDTVSINPAAGEYIGPSLAIGFIFMILVDQLSGGNSHVHIPADTRKPDKQDNDDTTIHINSPNTSSHNEPFHNTSIDTSQSALYGILVHSAVDGLALGAISVSENKTLEFIVFLAIILHKGPAAFGLVSYLQLSLHTRIHIIQQLVIFSLAAPCTAFITYIAFNGFNIVTHNTNNINVVYLGYCLLFSAGTFLFTIAVHILPEITSKHNDNNKSHTQNTITDWKQTICLIIGILLPWAISASHPHAH